MTLEEAMARAAAERYPEETADILDGLGPGEAAGFLSALAPSVSASILGRMAPAAGADCLAVLDTGAARDILEASEVYVATALLRRLGPEQRQTLLDALPERRKRALRSLLSHTPRTAGALMDPTVVALPPDTTTGTVREHIARRGNTAGGVYAVARTDQTLVGQIPLGHLIAAAAEAPLGDLCRRDAPRLRPEDPQEMIFHHAGWNEWNALPVVDEAGRLLGGVDQRVLSRLREAEQGQGQRSPVSLAVSFAELYWTGLTGITAGLAGSLPQRKDDGQG